MNPTIRRYARLARCRRDFAYAYTLINEGFTAPPHVLRWDEVIKDKRQRKVRKTVNVAPTGCLKSSTNNTHALQYLVTAHGAGQNPTCLFGTQSPPVRKRTVRLERSCIYDLYGKEGDLWEAHQFEMPDLPQKARDPSFFGASTGAAIEGLRYLKGLCDDISDGKSEYSEAARLEVERWLLRTFLLRLNDEADCDVWGSFWSVFDILMILIKQGWEADIWPMFGEVCPEQFKQYPNVRHHGEEYTHLWPERYGHLTPEQYMQRELMTIQTFNLRVQCNPFGVEGRQFDPLWIVEEVPTAEIIARSEVMIGHDPRDVTAGESSEESIVVVLYDPHGVDKNGESGVIYVTENPAGWWDWADVETNVTKVCLKHNIQRYTIEKSPLSGGHIGWLRMHSPLKDDPGRIVEQPAGGNKDARINTLAPHVRSGKIRFAPHLRELINQLLAHPGGKMKDRADSLEIAVRHLLEVGARPTYTPGMGKRRW